MLLKNVLSLSQNGDRNAKSAPWGGDWPASKFSKAALTLEDILGHLQPHEAAEAMVAASLGPWGLVFALMSGPLSWSDRDSGLCR